jgi:hypothetical protein
MSGHLTLTRGERYVRAADREAIMRVMLSEGV